MSNINLPIIDYKHYYTFYWYSKLWSGSYCRFVHSRESADAKSPERNKRQTRAEEIEKCLDEGLEPT